MISPSSTRAKIFISYSHKDDRYLNQLLEHLAYYARNDLLDIWSDKQITPGAQWREEIKRAIEATKVAVILISSSFSASKFIAENELPPLFESAKKEGAIILPVIVRPSNFEDTELSNFQVVNNPSMPVAKMKGYQRDDLWAKVVREIKKAIAPQQTQYVTIASQQTETDILTQTPSQMNNNKLQESIIKPVAPRHVERQQMLTGPKQKIVKLVAQMRHYNLYPIELPDLEYLDDGQHPLHPLFESIVSEIHESLLIANRDELKAIYEALWPFFRDQVALDLLLLGDQQTLTLTAQFLVASLAQQSYFDVKRYIADDYRAMSEILHTYPEITTYEDDEGLIPLGKPGLTPAHMQDGGIYYKNHVLYYHPFLRRNFTSNLNYPFLNALVTYHQEHKDQRVAVAIDHLRIVPREWFRQIFERDRAFGPPLKVEKLDNPHTVGLTVHTLKPQIIRLSGLERTEFYWSIKQNDTKKAFEVEEVYSLDYLPDVGDDLVLARYIHAIRDIKAHAFIHLDGAVKIYRRNQYKQRYETKMPDELKAWKKIKVFRVDADVEKAQTISDNEWSKLIGYFFRGNTMVPEYLNPNYVNEG